MKGMKNLYPIEVTRYAMNNKIEDQPAFSWWVPYTVRKTKQIISKLKSKYWEHNHKYRMKVPKTADEAYQIDDENGNLLWADAIKEEMPKIKNAV